MPRVTREPSVISNDQDGFTATDEDWTDILRDQAEQEAGRRADYEIGRRTGQRFLEEEQEREAMRRSREILERDRLRVDLDRLRRDPFSDPADVRRIEDVLGGDPEEFRRFLRGVGRDNPSLQPLIDRYLPQQEPMPLGQLVESNPSGAVHTIAPITIGSDPELVFSSPMDFKPIPAYQYIEDERRIKVFGYDGHSETAELRPQPADDPIKHAENIKRIFNKARTDSSYQSVFSLLFYSSSLRDGVGGHIHFGHPDLIKGSLGDGSYQQKITPILNALDSLVSFPLMFLEIPEHARKRKNGGSYGKLSSYRADKNYGFEYRTPPSWLSTEELTKGTLCLSYAIVNEVLNKGWAMKNPLNQVAGFREMFQLHNTDLLLPLLPKIKPVIKSLELYPKYKDHIDYVLYNASRQNHIMNTEIKEGWSIPFVIMKDLAVLTIREFIERMTQAIVVPKNIEGMPIDRNFIIYRSTDFQIPQIAGNINVSLSQILPKWSLQNSDNKNVHIYAKKRELGNVFTVRLNPNKLVDMEDMKVKRLEKILQHIIRSFGDKTTTVEVKTDLSEFEKVKRRRSPVQIQPMRFSSTGVSTNSSTDDYFYNEPMMEYRPSPDQWDTQPIDYVAKVGIPREIRERKDYMAEAITLIVLLYANRSLYQSYKMDRITGQRISLPLMPQLLLGQIKQHVVPFQKSLPSEDEWMEDRSEEE